MVSRPPVIILGMHRSGTSLLASVLEDLGLFVGHEKEENNEAVYFQQLNDWMLGQASATWDSPGCFGFVTKDLEEKMQAVIELTLEEGGLRSFLGPEKAARYHDLRQLDFPWGWKDPRNTFTVDIWCRLFPEAKILHIYRHPVDVADSLRRRARAQDEHMQALASRYGIKWLFQRGVRFKLSPRVEFLEEGFALWREYVEKTLSLEEAYGNRCLGIKYEEFLLKPEKIAARAASFVGLEADDGQIARSCEGIDPGRRHAFLGNPELRRFHETIKTDSLVRKLGYDTLS